MEMDLTQHQQLTIQEWAGKTRYVKEVRLFGSRAKGCAQTDSDIDLAITVAGSTPVMIRANYYTDGKRWQDELTILLEWRVHVGLYNDPDSDLVRHECHQCSVLLFPLRSPEAP
jgi:predicted nucleotidyltransferase